MLPAGTIAEIATNIAGLKLEPATAAQILAAVLAPLFRSSQTEDLLPDKPARTQRRSPPRKKRRRATKANAEPADGPRERAIAALKANPDATLTAIAKAAGVSHGTAINARNELAAEARKEARRKSRASSSESSTGPKPATTERRQRAQRFLLDALAHGPKQVSDLEDAAEKAHIDPHTLGQARAELGVVTSRGNAGGVQAVQWSLPC